MRSLILIASILLAGPQTGGWGFGGNPRPGGSAPFFAAFTRSGAGTSGPCSTTNPTGSRGEAITFTRASSATCQKTNPGTANTGIANGDLVVLSSNQLRAEYGADGILGFRVEESRTNLTLRSQEFDNAAWTNDVAPTANAGVAPDGTTTAERFVYAATGVGARSVSFQSGGCLLAGTHSATAYVRGVSGSGTTDICIGAPSACAACSFVSTSWTRCQIVGASAAPGYIVVGNATLWNGGTTRTQSDVYVWGAQCENAGYPTSYIPTTSATVNRVADGDVSFSGVSLSSLASAGSSSATVTPIGTSGMSGGVIVFDTAGRPIYSSGPNMRIWDGTTEPAAAAGYSAGTAKRYWSSWSGATKSITNATDAVTGTDAFDGTMATTGPLRIGSSGLIGYGASWIITDTCLDQSTSRCR